MERSSLILGTGAEEFQRGYETFYHYFFGGINIKKNFYGAQSYFAWKNLDEVINLHSKEKKQTSGDNESPDRYENRLVKLCMCLYLTDILYPKSSGRGS